MILRCVIASVTLIDGDVSSVGTHNFDNRSLPVDPDEWADGQNCA